MESQIQDLLAQQEILRKQQMEVQMKVDAIYQALMGSNLLGAESGLVAKVAKQSVEIGQLQASQTKVEREMEKYKNTGKGIWIAIGIGAAILTWLVSHLEILKPINITP
jgi:hypothetical protein